MDFRILQFPRQNSQVIRAKSIPAVWIRSYAFTKDDGFFSSLVESDSEIEASKPHRLNWGAIYGIALTLAISTGFWMGVGVIVERLLK
jgi:hypothetical protein